VKLS